ncbi:MAG: ethanolamine ammonia lyase-activating protein [Chloroflexi bacterium]|nr:ethanolamine ammonia lyase-activating protein [Chloroflexota bacterium]
MSDESRESLSTMDRIDPYYQWLADEGPRVIEGLYCRDVGAAELAPWPRKGVDGAVFNFDGFKGNPKGNDLHIIEIPAGGSTNPERHMYEEIVYVHAGRGATSIWHDEKAKQSFEWQTGSLFAIPLNAHFQHFNASGDQKARLFSVTTAPTTLRQFHWNEEFIYDCPIDFTDRYGPEANYYTAEGTMWRSRNNHVWESNFVPDAPNMHLFEWKERGGGGRNVMLQMGEGNLIAHISEFQVGTYKKAHRHGPGAYLYILGGEGFSLLWQDGGEAERMKADWGTGSLFLAGAGGGEWFHQHFNSGKNPARYLALRGGNGSFKYGPNVTGAGRMADVSIKDGGIQLEYQDEDPEVHRIFEEEVRAHGAECRMKALSPYCTGETGPTAEGEWGDA